MTTRDDLVSGWSCDEKRTGKNWNCRNPFGCHCREITAHRNALEAKDAEIAKWRQAASVEAGLRREFLARAEAAESRISDLERQLAGETELCARAVYGAVGMIPMGQVDASEFLDKIEDAIAAAIRGGAK